MIRRIALVALAPLGIASASGAARAQLLTTQTVWKTYWMAIEAEKSCSSVGFTQGQYDAMTHVINVQIHNDLGAGERQALMSDAKNQVQDMTQKYGCDTPDIRKLLALYQSDLAPAAGVQ